MTDMTLDDSSKSERAYHWIRERIARHEYGPGFRLVLGHIAEALNMSVVPVREGIRRLEAEGLVTFERNVGARVSLVDPDQYVDAMQALGIVEGAATALAAPWLTADDLARADEINERMHMQLAHFDAHLFTTLNQQFHSVLFEPCPNLQLREMVHHGWSRLSGLRDSTFSFVPDRAPHSVEEHAGILDLIKRGADPLEIELAARSHRWRTSDAFTASRRNAGITPPSDAHSH